MLDSALLGFLTALLKFLVVAIPVAAGLWLAFRRRLGRAWDEVAAAFEGMRRIDDLAGDISEIKGTIGLVEATIRAMDDTNIEVAKFECAADGRVMYVNQTFARWIGVGKNELLQWNYTNFVHHEDRRRWRDEWELARREHRIFNQRYRFVDVDGQTITVDVHLTPIPERPPAKRWVGILRRVD